MQTGGRSKSTLSCIVSYPLAPGDLVSKTKKQTSNSKKAVGMPEAFLDSRNTVSGAFPSLSHS